LKLNYSILNEDARLVG